MKKKTYYCAKVEFYANGAVKTGIDTRPCKEKPKGQVRRNQIMTVYWNWFDSNEQAEIFIVERKAGMAA